MKSLYDGVEENESPNGFGSASEPQAVLAEQQRDVAGLVILRSHPPLPPAQHALFFNGHRLDSDSFDSQCGREELGGDGLGREAGGGLCDSPFREFCSLLSK